MLDSYRMVHGDELAKPATTWTPLENNRDEVHDRIDILYHSRNLRPITAEVVGARPDQANIVVTPYPTDHHAVVME